MKSCKIYNYDVLIADEANHLKSAKIDRERGFRVLARQGRVWLLTGTPIQEDAEPPR